MCIYRTVQNKMMSAFSRTSTTTYSCVRPKQNRTNLFGCFKQNSISI